MRCLPAHHFTVAKARAWRASIDDDPSYQRAGDAWTLGQRQRFIDSLLNGFDVPKIYLHDLRGLHPTKVYAVVDGKQRLTAIWSYLDGGFALADDLRIAMTSDDALPPGAVTPVGGQRFAQLHPAWQRRLLHTYLSVVLIRDATEVDIDELFARLNDGTPLTDAERRNAIAGDMSELVRTVADEPSLRDLLDVADARQARDAQRDVATMALAMADARRHGDVAPDLTPAGLERFVRANRRLEPGEASSLHQAVRQTMARATATTIGTTGRATDVASAIAAIEAVLDAGPVRAIAPRG